MKKIKLEFFHLFLGGLNSKYTCRLYKLTKSYLQLLSPKENNEQFLSNINNWDEGIELNYILKLYIRNIKAFVYTISPYTYIDES